MKTLRFCGVTARRGARGPQVVTKCFSFFFLRCGKCIFLSKTPCMGAKKKSSISTVLTTVLVATVYYSSTLFRPSGAT